MYLRADEVSARAVVVEPTFQWVERRAEKARPE